MRIQIRWARFVCVVIILGPPVGARTFSNVAAENLRTAETVPSSATLEEYKKRLDEYTRALEAFDRQAGAYWRLIDEKRVRIKKRRNNKQIVIDDYVLVQPPKYSGPPRPVDPTAVPGAETVPPKRYVPVVADFLKAAAEQFQFLPERPRNDTEFKRGYAKVAREAGLTKDQVVRIYGFEAGGNGNYDVQAGLEYPKPGAQAISTALGYNQLLTANTVGLLAEKGDRFIHELQKKAGGSPVQRKSALEGKIAVLGRMITVARNVPNRWSEHVRLGETPQGLGMHALNLDIDIGPLLQTQKLLDSVIFARAKGYKTRLTAAELEMMNLTGDGNGFDMVTMVNSFRERVPTSNFFQQAGYERNPVAIRNNVVAKLLTATDLKMDKESLLDGAKELAALFEK